VSSENRTTLLSTDAYAAAAEAFVDRARNRVGNAVDNLYVFGSTTRDEAQGLSSDIDVLAVLLDDAGYAAVDDALHGLAYDVMLEYGPVVELHVLTESAFERTNGETPVIRRSVLEGWSYA
jgi:predicted nucleotidyltransferase